MEGVLHERRRAFAAVKSRAIRFVFREEKLARAFRLKTKSAERRVCRGEAGVVELRNLRPRRMSRAGPTPGVTKPQRRQYVQARRFRPAICDRETNADVLRCGFRVLREDIEVAVAVEDAGVCDF